MFKKKKQPMDERIKKESNHLYAKMFYIMQLLNLILFFVKVVCKVPIYLYVLELMCLVVGALIVIVDEKRKGILFVKEKDEVLQTLHEDVLAKAFYANLWIIIMGEFVLMLAILAFAKEYFLWLISYFFIWLPPSLVVTIVSMKKGWLIWGTKKREVTGKKEFLKRVIIGSAFFGLFMAFPHIFRGGSFHPSGLLLALGMGAAWGIMFYILFIGMMKIAEKNADKNVEKQVVDSEKQENENCQN